MQKGQAPTIGIDARLLAYPLTGIGRYTHEMTRALLRAGADVTLYTPALPIHPLPQDQGRLRIKSSNLFGRSGRFIWGQLFLPVIARRDAPDIYWGPTHRLPPFLPAKTRAFVTIHDLVWKYAGDTMRTSSRLLEKTLMPEAIRRADGVIAVSDNTRKDILRAFPDMTCAVTTIYPGISDRPAGHPAAYLSKWGIARPYILFVGTLEPRKNLRRLLEAYAGLDAEERQQAALVIAGGAGWGDVDLATLITDLGLTGEVHLTGYVSEPELSMLYRHAIFLAMPSLYEGFGLPLVEAMSYGLPSLTSNLSSMPEIAGDTALLVDPLDTGSITRGLKDLISTPGLRQTLAARTSARSQLYDWDNAADRLLQVFSD